MKVALLVVCLAVALPACGQIETTVCDVVHHPAEFSGKIVRFRAVRITGFEVSAIRDVEERCSEPIWLDFAPELDKAWTRKEWATETEKTRDEDYMRFKQLNGRAAATMTGLIEHSGGLGYGHMNLYSIRFVLQSVSDPAIVEGTVYGQVVRADGKSVANAPIKALDTRGTPGAWDDFFRFSACSDENGSFKLKLPPGIYVFVVNLGGPIPPTAPFPVTYYSDITGTTASLTIQDKGTENLTIHLGDPLPTRVIPVKVVWPNGSPATGADMYTGEIRDSGDRWGSMQGITNEKAEFDLIGLEGVRQLIGVQISREKDLYCARVEAPPGDKLRDRVQLKLTKNKKTCWRMSLDMDLNMLSYCERNLQKK